MDVIEMLSDEATRAKLTDWAVAYALSHNSQQTDRERAMRACSRICAIWCQSITGDVIERVELGQ